LARTHRSSEPDPDWNVALSRLVEPLIRIGRILTGKDAGDIVGAADQEFEIIAIS